MTLPAGVRRVLTSEHGFTLPEMLSVLAILGTVLAALSTMFVAGLRGEADMNRRFQAQQEVRQALVKLRREAHCASQATATTPSAVTFTLGTYCPTAGGAGQTTWCVMPLGTQRYGLFRQLGASCDATGVKQADYLTSDNVFSTAIAVQNRRRLNISLSADVSPASPGGRYALDEMVSLRNGGRFGPRISITPDDTDVVVGQTVQLTVTLETDLGSGFQPTPNEHVGVTLTNALGASATSVTGTCTNPGPNTNDTDPTGKPLGQCKIAFTSLNPGSVIAHATSTLTIDGQSITVQTNGVTPNSGNALATFVTAT